MLSFYLCCISFVASYVYKRNSPHLVTTETASTAIQTAAILVKKMRAAIHCSSGDAQPVSSRTHFWRRFLQEYYSPNSLHQTLSSITVDQNTTCSNLSPRWVLQTTECRLKLLLGPASRCPYLRAIERGSRQWGKGGGGGGE
jgi:hypothetical protein